MRPFLAIADIIDGTFAVLSIDPTQRKDGGCIATVQSVHSSRAEAERALSAARGEDGK